MTLTATYHGTCADCGEPIIPGQQIETDDDGAWQHTLCGEMPAEKTDCVCSRCFLVHAGDCF